MKMIELKMLNASAQDRSPTAVQDVRGAMCEVVAVVGCAHASCTLGANDVFAIATRCTLCGDLIVVRSLARSLTLSCSAVRCVFDGIADHLRFGSHLHVSPALHNKVTRVSFDEYEGLRLSVPLKTTLETEEGGETQPPTRT